MTDDDETPDTPTASDYEEIDQALAACAEEGAINGAFCKRLGTKYGVTQRHIMARAARNGLPIEIGTGAEQSPPSYTVTGPFTEWPAELRASIERDVLTTADSLAFDSELASEIAARHGVSARSIISFAASQGVPLDIKGKGGKAKHRKSKTAPKLVRPTIQDNQYGVLQGAANVTGGCATMWGGVALIGAIILLGVAIKMIFTGDF
jgi:hypothetical protein